jgi:ornithine decarboxylase
VLTDLDKKLIEKVYNTKFNIPVFVVSKSEDKLNDELIDKVYSIIDTKDFDLKHYSQEIENAARQYEEGVLPPFFKT